MKALIFDCDGVLVDTERDGHRVAFNRAFEQMGYKFQWDVDLYGQLLKIAGGKERMKYYFDKILKYQRLFFLQVIQFRTTIYHYDMYQFDRQV